MLQSQPLPLAYATNLFKFAKVEHNDELQSLPDDESISSLGSYSRERKTPPIDQEERPLNLSCKRKPSSDSDREPINFNKGTEGIATQFRDQTVERAILQYRNQVLASNDFFRNYIQQKWKEELNSRSQQYQAKTSASSFVELNERRAQWLAMMNAIQNFGNGQRYFDQETARSDHAKERMSVIVQPNISSPAHLSPNTALSVNRSQPISSPSYATASFFPKQLSPIQASISPKQPSSPTLTFRPLMKLAPSDDLNQSVKQCSPIPNSSPDLPLKKRQKTKSNYLPGEGSASNTESFRCTVCGATYPHKFELNRHVKVSHIRPHRCGQCGKGFGHRNYLKVHIETVHLGRKSHHCRLCGKYLSTGGNLNVHVRTIHLGEKKYNCPVCSRSFGQQCNMKTHMKRHFTKCEEL